MRAKAISVVLSFVLMLSIVQPVKAGGMPVYDAANWLLQHLKWLWEQIVEHKKSMAFAEISQTLAKVLSEVEKIQEVIDTTNKMYETMKWSLEKLEDGSWSISDLYKGDFKELDDAIASFIQNLREEPAAYEQYVEAIKKLQGLDELNDHFERIYWSTKQLKQMLDEIFNDNRDSEDYVDLDHRITKLQLQQNKKLKADATIARINEKIRQLREKAIPSYEEKIKAAETPMQQQELSNMGLANVQRLLLYQTQVQARMLEVLSELLSIQGSKIARQIRQEILDKESVGADMQEEEKEQMFNDVSRKAASVVLENSTYTLEE